MKSLRLAIKLGQKLMAHDYAEAYDRHYQKWGRVEMTFRAQDSGTSLVEWRRGGKLHKPCEVEKAELLAAFKADDEAEARDRRLFYSIIALYGPRWWD